MDFKNRVFTMVLTLLIICGILLGSFLWMKFEYNRYQIEQKQLLNEYKPIFQEYLSERYAEEMVVGSIYKGANEGEYDCYTYTKRNPEISFYTFVEKDKANNNYIFSDHYFQVLWQIEVGNEIENYIKSIYNNIHSVDFKIMGIPQYDENPIQYVFDFKDYIPKSKIPTYNEIKDNPSLKDYYRTLDININGDVNSSNEELEYVNIFKVVQFVKKKGYNPDYLKINYGQGSKSGKNSSFSSESRNMFIFDKMGLSKINSLDDLKSVLKK